jgi:hypothetical protein
MSRPLRPRLPGKRHPSGELVRSEREAGYSPAVSKRLRDAAARGMADPSWGTALGQLLMAGKITHDEHMTGMRYDELHREYLKVLEPPPDGTSKPIGEPRKGEPPHEDSEAGERANKRAKKIRLDYERAEAVLEATVGKQGLNAVDMLCVGNGRTPDSYAALLLAKKGLNALAALWQLGRRKQDQRR